MNLLLLLVILIFALFMILGFLRGLIKSVCKMVMMICALLLAYILTPFVTDMVIENTGIDDTIRENVYSRIEGYVTDRMREQTAQMLGKVDEQAAATLTHTFMNSELTRNEEMQVIQEIPFPNFMKEALLEHNNRTEREELQSKGFFDFLATYIARMVMRAIVFFALLVIFTIIFTLLVMLLSFATKLPIVSSVNRIGGIIFGAIEALLIVWVLFVVVAMIANSSIGVEAYDQIMDNAFLKTLYDRNILMSIVTIFK